MARHPIGLPGHVHLGTDTMKRTVTLSHLVDYRGTAMGPGTIFVDEATADVLVKYHDAVRGELVGDDLQPLPGQAAEPQAEQKQAGKLSDAELLSELQKRGLEAAAPAVVAVVAERPLVQVPEGTPGVVAEIMQLDEAQIRKQLGEREVTIPEDATEKLQLAVLLARAAGYKFVMPGEEQEGEQEGREIPKGALPAGFPARAKLMAAGFTTLAKLVAAKADELPELDQAEKDLILAELAVLGE